MSTIKAMMETPTATTIKDELALVSTLGGATTVSVLDSCFLGSMNCLVIWSFTVIERSLGMNTDFYLVVVVEAPAVMVIGSYPGAETTPPEMIETGVDEELEDELVSAWSLVA